jgi:hypothetical protein
MGGVGPMWSPRGDQLVFSVDDSVLIGEPDRTESAEAPGVVPISLADGVSG